MRFRTRGLLAGVAALLVAAGCEKREMGERETVAAPMQSAPGTTSEGQPAPPPLAAQRSPREELPPRADAQRPTEPLGASATQPQQLSGEVLAFTGKELVVLSAHEGQGVRMLVIPGTEVRVDGRPATAADIREGGEVRATYEYAEGKPIALLVEVRNPEDEPEQPLLDQPRIPKSED